MITSRMLCMLLAIGMLASCNSSTSSEWKPISNDSYEARFEKAMAICNGRAAETQVSAGRLWIAGAIASNSTFRACMAEHGFAPAHE
ncbi:hypothetical protein [Mesorhizobium sp. J18]|uniref:hypothetical protein n=1 Tax=Mesorhizobium sp. J18 TaxID=935263 RepID=UPI001FEE5D74|nr:hypothetical protein [Mesorhizobium sp. J18]